MSYDDGFPPEFGEPGYSESDEEQYLRQRDIDYASEEMWMDNSDEDLNDYQMCKKEQDVICHGCGDCEQNETPHDEDCLNNCGICDEAEFCGLADDCEKLKRLRNNLKKRFPDGAPNQFCGFNPLEQEVYGYLVEQIVVLESKITGEEFMTEDEADDFNRKRFEAGLSPWIMNYPDVYCFRGEDEFSDGTTPMKPYNFYAFRACTFNFNRTKIVDSTSECGMDRMFGTFLVVN